LIVGAALFTVGWIVVALVPAAQGMMVDFAASFLLNVTVMGLLWYAARASVGRPAANVEGRASVGRPSVNKGRCASVGRPAANVEGANDGDVALRRFWRALAIAWALNIAGNVAWGIHDVMTSEPLGIFTWIDGLYLARYALIGWALWHYPREPRCWTDVATVMLIATALIWATLFRVMLPSIPRRPALYFMGGALYPILDAALIYAALLTWLRLDARAWVRRAVGLFALAMLVYGAANWINFTVRAIALEASSQVAAFFWLLADGLTGGAAFLIAEFGSLGDRSPPAGQGASTVRWTSYVPYIASVLVLGIMLVDWIVRSAPDWMLITCTVATIGITTYHAVASPSPSLGEGARG
jgi:hypothetical protein